jgi:hypothetical protein
MGAEEEELDPQEIVEILEELGLCSEDLDDLIHEVASSIAAEVNNSGMGEQVAFLLEHGWDEDEIIAYLDSMKEAANG